MSVEYVIENHKTKTSIYCTGAFGAIEPKHLIGGREVIELNLSKHLFSLNPVYHYKYCKWAATVIAKFIGDAQVEDIDVHPDEYFIYDDWDQRICMYKSEEDLDELLAEMK